MDEQEKILRKRICEEIRLLADYEAYIKKGCYNFETGRYFPYDIKEKAIDCDDLYRILGLVENGEVSIKVKKIKAKRRKEEKEQKEKERRAKKLAEKSWREILDTESE